MEALGKPTPPAAQKNTHFFAVHLKTFKVFKMTILRHIIPNIRSKDFGQILKIAFLGGLIGGLYGMAHDQLTYSISHEYFTKVKFLQFHYADLGLGPRVFASTTGFIATFWLGFAAAWFFGRKWIPKHPRKIAFQMAIKGFKWIILSGMVFALMGYLYSLSRGNDADFTVWEWVFEDYQIENRWAFVCVAYIHNPGYLGALVGFLLAIFKIHPVRRKGSLP